MRIRLVLALLLFCILTGCSQPDMGGGSAKGKIDEGKIPESSKSPSKPEAEKPVPKPEGYQEIVDRVHGIRFYLPEGWVYRVNEGVASFYEPSYSRGVIVVPLSNVLGGVEGILRHFGEMQAYAKGDERSLTFSFESDLSSVISLSMPGKIGEVMELRKPGKVRVVVSAFKGREAGIAYVFFFDGDQIPEELKVIVRSLEFIREREELKDVEIGEFATVKLPEGYITSGKAIQSQSCPGYYSGIYGKVEGPDGGSFEFVYGEYSFAYYTSLDLGEPLIEELIRQQGLCFYEYVDFKNFQELFGRGGMEMCYKSVGEYTDSVISMLRERHPDLEVESFDLNVRGVPENMNPKLYVLTSKSNPMFVAYVIVQGIEMENYLPISYGISVGVKMVGGFAMLSVIDAKSPEEFSVFMNLKDGLKLKDEWYQRNTKRLRECTEYYMRETRKEIQHSREISNMITETFRDISAMHWDSWEKEQRFQEEMAESVTRILSDYTALRDPETQEVYEVESFAQRYWINDEGQILGTSWDVSESDLIAEGWRPLEENPAGFVRGMWG